MNRRTMQTTPTMTPHRAFRGLALAALLGSSIPAHAHGDAAHAPDPAAANDHAVVSHGTRDLVAGPVTIRMLAEAANLGRGDVEVGELNLPVEYGEGAAHAHGSLELFYVVAGTLGHEVNGVAHALAPGMLGIVQPGDTVRHSVIGETPVKAVVIWVPGGEAERLVEQAGFAVKPVE
ncbi:MAG: cupin domain-containing protein [Gammaproteobacteria bacterium]|nr:cupin domain-containing protein [Gammaproteobacteria bacterium]MCP5199066.1 cupin domain-containing protein [Gammaproteobacteria bacterium]